MLKTIVSAYVFAMLTLTSLITYAQPKTDPAGFSPALVGTWKSAPDETRLTSDFDKSVWGVNATAVRTLELTVRPDGEGTLLLTKKVLDGKGRVVPASTLIEEARLTLGPATAGVATRIEHAATVVKAVRRYPDDPDYQSSIDGLRVEVVTFQDGDGNTIEVRYDTPEGRGSFWDTLRRQGRSPRGAAR